MTRLQAAWLESVPAQTIAAALHSSGFTALFVGGCVRNTLLGEPVNDIDLATDAHPDQVIGLAGATGIRAIPTGVEHGTVTLVVDGTPVEVTTFRTDVETDGRHARVHFTDNVAIDAARRDFTMNALYATADGTLVDPLQGLPDLLARRIRFVGHAPDRVKEDYLRILRFFRFHAWYGAPDAGMDAESLAACAHHAEGLVRVSAERITSELVKLLSAANPAPSVATMAQSGILARILPGADPNPLPLFQHWQGTNVHPMARMAALGGDRSTLRLSSAQTKLVETLTRAALSTDPPAALGYRLGETDGRAALHLRAAWLETQPDTTDIPLGARAKFPLKAADLVPHLQGPALGLALRQLEQDWIASRFTLPKEELIRRAHDL